MRRTKRRHAWFVALLRLLVVADLLGERKLQESGARLVCGGRAGGISKQFLIAVVIAVAISDHASRSSERWREITDDRYRPPPFVCNYRH